MAERRGRRARNNAEDRLQAALVAKLPLILNKGWFYFHVPNGGKMPPVRAYRLSRLGVVPGVPDIVFVGPPNGRAYGLELKAESGTQSPEQLAVEHAWNTAGGDYRLARGMVAALEALETWGALRPGSYVREAAA